MRLRCGPCSWMVWPWTDLHGALNMSQFWLNIENISCLLLFRKASYESFSLSHCAKVNFLTPPPLLYLCGYFHPEETEKLLKRLSALPWKPAASSCGFCRIFQFSCTRLRLWRTDGLFTEIVGGIKMLCQDSVLYNVWRKLTTREKRRTAAWGFWGKIWREGWMYFPSITSCVNSPRLVFILPPQTCGLKWKPGIISQKSVLRSATMQTVTAFSSLPTFNFYCFYLYCLDWVITPTLEGPLRPASWQRPFTELKQPIT